MIEETLSQQISLISHGSFLSGYHTSIQRCRRGQRKAKGSLSISWGHSSIGYLFRIGEKTAPYTDCAVFLFCRRIASHKFLTSPLQTVKTIRWTLLYLFPPLHFNYHSVGHSWRPLLLSVRTLHALLMQRVWYFDCSKSMWKPYLIGRSHGI